MLYHLRHVLLAGVVDHYAHQRLNAVRTNQYHWKLNTGHRKAKDERADLMAVSEKPLLTFTIDFETAKRYREANKMPHQFRRAAWTDLTVEVYL